MREWKLEMQGEYEKFYRNRSYNIEQFYLSLEKISKSHLADGTMQEGDSFAFPTSNGLQYKLSFYNDVTELQQIDEDGSRHDLLRRKDYKNADQYKVAQSAAFSIIGHGLRGLGDHIGERFPDKLRQALENLTPGMLVSFTDGKSYVCTGRPQGNIVELKQAYSGDVRNLTLDSLKNNPKITVNTARNTDMQKFYNDNHKKLTQRVELNVSFSSKAKEFVDLIERNVEYNKPHRINMGNVTLIAKKNRDNSVAWFDGKGNRVEKKDVIMLNAILNCGINERNYIRKNPTNMDIANDVSFEKKIEALSNKKFFGAMYDSMIDYVKDNKTNLSIESYQYEKNGENFTPARISFAERDGLVKAVKVTYKDNDFAKEENEIKDITRNEFIELCEQIYTENHKVLATRTEEVILKKLNKAKEELTPEERADMDQYIEKTLNGSIKVVETSMQRPDKTALTSLVQAYLKESNAKEVTAKDIKDTWER